jgi:hypothetical protein
MRSLQNWPLLTETGRRISQLLEHLFKRFSSYYTCDNSIAITAIWTQFYHRLVIDMRIDRYIELNVKIFAKFIDSLVVLKARHSHYSSLVNPDSENIQLKTTLSKIVLFQMFFIGSMQWKILHFLVRFELHSDDFLVTSIFGRLTIWFILVGQTVLLNQEVLLVPFEQVTTIQHYDGTINYTYSRTPCSNESTVVQCSTTTAPASWSRASVLGSK